MSAPRARTMQVKVQCDRKKKKSAANSKVFVCACCVPWCTRGCAGRIRDFGEDEGFLFCAAREYTVMLPHWPFPGNAENMIGHTTDTNKYGRYICCMVKSCRCHITINSLRL